MQSVKIVLSIFVSMWLLWLPFDNRYRLIKYMVCLNKGNNSIFIRNRYVLKLIYSIAHCSKITNTVAFTKHRSHDFSAFVQFPTGNVRVSEGTFCHVAVHM